MTIEWLSSALEQSRALGFLGPGPIETHIEHAQRYARVWNQFRSQSPGRVVDLGSGGGVPGLVLFEAWGTEMVLLDSMEKRCRFLRTIISDPRVPAGLSVAEGRAEELAHDPHLEGTCDLVVARSFGPPSATAECAVRFLGVGGLLIVSEPPDVPQVSRWPRAGLGQLGLKRLTPDDSRGGYVVMEKIRPTPAEFPRRVGTPGKKPLFP